MFTTNLCLFKVKPEPDDDPAEVVFSFTELQPLVGVFLDPEEVPKRRVKQPDDWDPLALGTEIVRCKVRRLLIGY
ncbi:Protein of unknown function [Gryllus bimaculatus]|nr:Protein of unknown function [Gryllus bimaculatus]